MHAQVGDRLLVGARPPPDRPDHRRAPRRWPAALHHQVAERRPHRDGVPRPVLPHRAGQPPGRHRARRGGDVMTTATFALLMDGSTVEIRPGGPQDADAVREMHAALSPENAYLRFFSLSPLNAEREAQRVCREPGPDHAALLAWLGGELAGVASYESSPAKGRGAGRDRVRRARPPARPRHRHPAARAPGVDRPAAAGRGLHGRDAGREHGHAGRVRRRRPAGTARATSTVTCS